MFFHMLAIVPTFDRDSKDLRLASENLADISQSPRSGVGLEAHIFSLHDLQSSRVPDVHIFVPLSENLADNFTALAKVGR
jgi:hypothetical protein